MPKLLGIVIATALVSILAGAAALYDPSWRFWNRSERRQEAIQNPQNETAPDVSNWKTYRNNGIEFKYPETWQLSEEEGYAAFRESTHAVAFFKSGETAPEADFSYENLGFAKRADGYHPRHPRLEAFGNKAEEENFNGLNFLIGTVYIGANNNEGEGSIEYIAANINGNSYVKFIVFDEKNILLAILSTLKVPVAPAVDSKTDTSAWKTYRNEEHGFEVKYPADWKINDASYIYECFSSSPSGARKACKNASLGIESQVRHDVKGFESVGAKFLLRMHFNNGRVTVDHASYIKVRESTDQAVTVIPMDDDALQQTDEYDVAQKIIKSARIIEAQTVDTSGPMGIVFPQNCGVVGWKGDFDPSSENPANPAGNFLVENEWLIDCGSKNNAARGTIGPILEQQGWKFCDSQTAVGHWHKNGIITTVAESAGITYPFKLSQRSNQPECLGDNF